MKFKVTIRPTLLAAVNAPWDQTRRDIHSQIFADHWFIEAPSDCVVCIHDPNTILIECEQSNVDDNVVKDAINLSLLRFFDIGIDCDSDIEVTV